jgi:hypothetical protein
MMTLYKPANTRLRGQVERCLDLQYSQVTFDGLDVLTSMPPTKAMSCSKKSNGKTRSIAVTAKTDPRIESSDRIENLFGKLYPFARA